MDELGPPDKHYFMAAIGWMELKNYSEAKAELLRLKPDLRCHADVLELRWMIAAAQEDWADAAESARLLQESAPDRASGWLHHAYALRRITGGGLDQAWEALMPAVERFPEEPIIPYNLSCYACQMDKLDDARDWLKRAAASGGKASMKKLALRDVDLKPLWAEIKAW